MPYGLTGKKMGKKPVAKVKKTKKPFFKKG